MMTETQKELLHERALALRGASVELVEQFLTTTFMEGEFLGMLAVAAPAKPAAKLSLVRECPDTVTP